MGAGLALGLSFATAVPARAADLSFDAQCPLRLASAGNLTQACLGNAFSVMHFRTESSIK
jgi:hypothetical protein